MNSLTSFTEIYCYWVHYVIDIFTLLAPTLILQIRPNSASNSIFFLFMTWNRKRSITTRWQFKLKIYILSIWWTKIAIRKEYTIPYYLGNIIRSNSFRSTKTHWFLIWYYRTVPVDLVSSVAVSLQPVYQRQFYLNCESTSANEPINKMSLS